MEKNVPGNRLLQYAAPAMVALSVLATACSGEQGATAPPASQEITTTAQPPDRTQCIEPTPAEIDEAEALLAAPEDPRVYWAFATGKGGDVGPDDHKDFMADIARQEGVTIYNSDDIRNQLSMWMHQPSVGPQQSFDYYLSATNQFMNQYGVSVEVGKPDGKYSYGGHAPSREDLESVNGKQLLVNILGAYSNKPREYVALQGLKQIVLLSGTESSDVAGYVDVAPETDHDKIFLDINRGSILGPIWEQGIRHEGGHLVDRAQCGPDDMFKDAGFVALNGNQNIYVGTVHDPNTPSITGRVSGKMSNLMRTAAELAAKNGDVAALCSFQKLDNEEAAGVMTYSQYHPSVEEDKAELQAVISDNNEWVDLADPRYKVLYPKFRSLLARLLHQNRPVARYFARTSRRPLRDPLLDQC